MDEQGVGLGAGLVALRFVWNIHTDSRKPHSQTATTGKRFHCNKVVSKPVLNKIKPGQDAIPGLKEYQD